jgi:uncharacterized membrane protein
MRPNATPPHAGRSLGFERFIFFSDAVFAIAITLLVLDLRPPAGGRGAFLIAPFIPNLVAFAISFYVIGRFWLAHHHLFETIQAYDSRLLAANLCFLASIAFLPFPTNVIAQYKADSAPVIFYTVSVAIVGVLMVLLALVARRPALLRPGETRGGTVRIVVRMAGSPIVFIVAAAVAVSHPHLALWLLLSMIPLGWILEPVGRALERRVDAVRPPPGRPRPRISKAGGRRSG